MVTPERKLVLKRGPEGTSTSKSDTIKRFSESLQKALNLYSDSSANKKHLMSVLDDTLKSAELQQNSDAILLSAWIIYYLKLQGYKVEPFVKRLRKVERAHKMETKTC